MSCSRWLLYTVSLASHMSPLPPTCTAGWFKWHTHIQKLFLVWVATFGQYRRQLIFVWFLRWKECLQLYLVLSIWKHSSTLFWAWHRACIDYLLADPLLGLHRIAVCQWKCQFGHAHPRDFECGFVLGDYFTPRLSHFWTLFHFRNSSQWALLTMSVFSPWDGDHN